MTRRRLRRRVRHAVAHHGPRIGFTASVVAVLASCVAACLHPAEVAAQEAFEPRVPPVVELNWVRGVGAEACVSSPELRADVRRRLGRDPFGLAGGTIIEGSIERDETGFRVRLRSRDPNGLAGERMLEEVTEDCRALDAAIALALALVIDPEAALGPPAAPEPEPEPEPRPEPAPAPEPEACPTVEAPGDELRLVADVAALGALDLVPGPALGARLAAALELLSWLRVQIALAHVPERPTGDASSGDPAAFAIGWTAAALGLCGAPFRVPEGGIELCVNGWAGGQHVVVYAPIPTAPGVRAFGAVDASVQGDIRLFGPLSLRLGLALMFPFARYAFRVEEVETAEFTVPIVIPSTWLGFAFSSE